MKSITVWDAQPTLAYLWRGGMVRPQLFDAAYSALLESLVQQGGCESDMDHEERILQWQADGLVEKTCNGARQSWHLTEAGKQRLAIGMVGANPRRFLAERDDVPPAEKSKLELMCRLEAAGWEMKSAQTTAEVKAFRKQAGYAVGDDTNTW